MKTGTVVLNYNDAKTTIEFVSTICKYDVLDCICVVDNGSTDDSLIKLQELESDKVVVLSSIKNIGYAGGNNIGLRYLFAHGCENLIVSNPDILCQEQDMKDFVAYMDTYPEYALFGPTIEEKGTMNRGWKQSSIGHDIRDNIPYLNRLFKKAIRYSDKHYYKRAFSKVDCVSGCFFGIKRTTIETVGYLDEGTFLYYEENIYGKKVKDAGLETIVLNYVSIVHNHSVTINKVTNRYQRLRALKDSQIYYHEHCYKHTRFSLYLLRKMADFDCFIARLRTDKKLLRKHDGKRKKVAILSLHMKVGGIEKAICSLANMLVDTYDVEIINVYKLVEKPAFFIDERVRVKYLTTLLQPNKEALQEAIKTKNPWRILKEGNEARHVVLRKREVIKRLAKDCDADIIVSSTLAFDKYFGKYQNDKTLVAWEHCHPNGDEKYVKKVLKCTNRFDVFIPSSKALYQFYKARMVGPKCMYVPLCIDYFPSEQAPLQTKQITVMGRLSKEKAYDDMLQVFSQVVKEESAAILNILGEGEEQKRLQELATTLGIQEQVVFHGNLVDEEKEKVLLNTSVFVTTSHYESFGLVLLEAMSYGIPCLSFTSAKGSLEIIQDGYNGYLIENRDNIAMKDKIVMLLQETTAEMKDAAIATAKTYHYDVVKEQWLDAFSYFARGQVNKRVIFTSSAGGHYSELSELSELMEKYNSFILTEDHEMMQAYKQEPHPKTWYLRPGTKEHLAKFLWNFPFNICRSFLIYRKVKPDVVIATGAHTTVPICYIAKLFRKKVIYIETFANITTKTLSGKLVYPIADLFLVQWEEMLALYPKAKYKGWLK